MTEENNEQLAKVEFSEKPLDGEPESDRLLTLQSGVMLRERMIVADITTMQIKSEAEVEPSGFAISISNALLEADGSVAKDEQGRFKIAPAHEISFTDEALARLGSKEAIALAVEDARQIAAAKAETIFKGRELAKEVLGERLKGI